MGGGGGEDVHVYRFNIQHSLFSPFRRAARSSAMCGLSVRSHGKKKTFPMISADDGRSETLSFLSTTIYLGRSDLVRWSLVAVSPFIPFSSELPRQFRWKKHPSLFEGYPTSRWYTGGGTLIYRTRVESNVDKESDGTRVGRKGRKRRRYNPGRSSVGQPDDTPSQL